MINQTRFLLALAAFALFATAACKKDDDNTAEDRTTLLVDANWHVTAFTVDPPVDVLGVLISDFFAVLEDCQKDNLFVFKSDGKLNYDEGLPNAIPAIRRSRLALGLSTLTRPLSRLTEKVRQ